MRVKKISLIGMLAVSVLAFGQKSDRDIYNSYNSTMANSKQLPIGELIAKSGHYFVGTPYVGGTLEGNEPERLVINLHALDCVTFIDNVIALSYNLQQVASYENYCSIIQKNRYRGGIINGYLSRIHYTSEWIKQSTQGKWISDVTEQLGGKKIMFNLNFMSTHPQYYPMLKGRQSRIDSMAVIEKRLSQHTYNYIPKNQVAPIEKEIKNGDIILIVTSNEGIDYAHMGIAVHREGKLRLLHASSDLKSIVYSTGSLSDYLMGIKKHKGITILRCNSILK